MIHGFVKPGAYVSNKEYTITSFDFASYYPHLQFTWDCIAEHIPSTVYSQLVKDLFKKRKEHPKGTSLNYVIKIFINLLYGLSNSEYSALYDTKATLKTTINGMLILSMIADKVYLQDEDNVILMKNTDGLEIYHKRSNYDTIIKIFDEISSLVKIPYEVVEYKKLIGLNVNNYISIDINDNVKTKGVFEDYEDIINAGMYHKDTSASIIPKALKKYFLEGNSIEETINNETNIYEFCYGNPKTKEFNWLLVDTKKGVPIIKRFDDRFVRYYASYDQSLQKDWISGGKKGQIENLQSKTQIQLYQNATKEVTTKIENLNRQWYIDECIKIIKIIENDTI